MSFDYDGTGVTPQQTGEFKLLPDGWYLLKVDEIEKVGQSKEKKHPLVTVNLKVADGQYKGNGIRYHNITFLPKDEPGAGMAIHWLKSIGQPWENKFKVSPKSWVGAMFYGQVKSRKKSEDSNKIYNEVKAILSCDDYESGKDAFDTGNPEWLGGK